MNRLPAFPPNYDSNWGNTFNRTLETNFTMLFQPISTGWSVSLEQPKRNIGHTSATGYIGNVSVNTNNTTNTSVSVSGVGGTYSGSLENTDNVLETLISDMKIRGMLG